MPCQWEDVWEPSGLPIPLCAALTLPRGYHCQGIALGLSDVSASGKTGKVSQREENPGFLTLLVVTCDKKALFKGRMKKRWERGWAVTQCSKRNKFRLCVTHATLGLTHLLQENTQCIQGHS